MKGKGRLRGRVYGHQARSAVARRSAWSLTLSKPVLLGFIFSERSFKSQGFQVLSKFVGRLSSRKPDCGLFGG